MDARLLDYDGLKGIEWEWQAIDGAMTKAPLGKEQTGPNPTDRAKRGVKRSLLVEGNGVPLGVVVDGANRNDFKMARATLESIPIDRPKPTKEDPSICAWIKVTIMTKYEHWGRNLVIPYTFARGMKKLRRSNGKSASKLEDGWWNERIVG